MLVMFLLLFVSVATEAILKGGGARQGPKDGESRRRGEWGARRGVPLPAGEGCPLPRKFEFFNLQILCYGVFSVAVNLTC